MTWLLARYLQRDESHNNPSTSSDQSQTIPVWLAYNSAIGAAAVNRSPMSLDKPHTLPIINAPVHEWQTIVTAMDSVYRLNKLAFPDSHDPILMTNDVDLYKRALKLQFLDDEYNGKWWLVPGAFHTSLCGLRCLGKTIENNGLPSVWIEAKLYSSVVANQIINGSHYRRAVEAHEITRQALSDLWFDSFFSERPHVLTALTDNIQKLSDACNTKKNEAIKEVHQNLMIQLDSMNPDVQFKAFHDSHMQYPLYRWLRIYMEQVQNLLQFHRSVHEPNFFLYLAAIEEMSTYFFAYHRLDYAQNMMEFLARAYESKEVYPGV